MRLRRNGPGAWQATTDLIQGRDGTFYYGVHTTGRLLWVLWWHPRYVRILKWHPRYVRILKGLGR